MKKSRYPVPLDAEHRDLEPPAGGSWMMMDLPGRLLRAPVNRGTQEIT